MHPHATPTRRWYPLSNHSAVSATFSMLTNPIFNVIANPTPDFRLMLANDFQCRISRIQPHIIQMLRYTTYIYIYILDCAEVWECRRFVLSTFLFVVVLVYRRSVLSTFRFVDVLVCRYFGCRHFSLSTFWLITFTMSHVKRNKWQSTELGQA